MLLRRLSEHVRTQNWLAVGLDFLIVVAGVFIGIQLGNWNAERADRLRADELRERLVSDFELLEESLASTNDRLRTFTQAAVDVQVALRSGQRPADDERFGRTLNLASSTQPAVGGSPTYAEMVSSGDLGLLKDPALRTALVEYQQLTDLSQNTSNIFLPEFLQMIRTVDPHIEHAVEPDESGFPVVITYDFDALRGNDHVYKAKARANRNLLSLYAYQQELADNVLSRLRPNDIEEPD